ncbi:fumarylacetoacetate hydrolase family protein [Tepidibacillus infernus]|uniref:fumarylacetoacetate hydrolase family protein n=1 Tax=Tepidibacillus TaxID=1494427 RepID=UPI0008538A6C|nr:fumarylacetoacetate hydrolase family protein [Tepidibacillus sp. HK-1]GBF12344.1 ureidoglycolate lyase [Tepidibacillus sp. HK-1]
MRFVTFQLGQETKLGVVNEEVTEVIDLQRAQSAKEVKLLPTSMIEAITLGDSFIKDVNELLEWVELQENRNWVYQLNSEEVTLLAPIPRPPKNIFCLGKNYAAHALEMGSADEIPKHPMVFTKAATSVNGPFADIWNHSDITSALDYEGELAVVIGKKGSKISKEEAFDYVFGYTMINDITARDLQKRHKQFFLGKSLDTACPMGPFIAYKSLIIDPNNLHIETRVNGEVRQSANTEQLIFDIPTIISTISQGTTLEPGDVIATGTPAGVGEGFTPPRYLKANDIVEIHVEGLGWLRNKIIESSNRL